MPRVLVAMAAVLQCGRNFRVAEGVFDGMVRVLESLALQCGRNFRVAEGRTGAAE